MTTPTAGAPAVTMTAARKGLILATCCMSLLVIGLDNTIVNVALPAISRDLGGGVTGLQWVVDAYILVLASLYLLGGWIGDRFGRRRTFLTGLTIFISASAACSLAGSVPVLGLFRGAQAVGGAMLNPVALAILANTFTDPRERARAIGLWGSVIGISMALGPVLGGVLVEYLGWRAAFWVNVPVGLVAIGLTLALVPESRADRVTRFDVPGQLLITATLCCLLFGIIEMPHAGASPLILGAFAVAALSAVALLVVERRRSQPLLDLRFFASIPFSASTAIAVTSFVAFGAFLFTSTLYLQAARGLSPIQAGLCLMPLALMTIAMSTVSGMLVARFGSRPSLLLGAGAFGASGLLLAVLDPGAALGWFLVAFGIFGIGFGAINAPVTATGVASMPRQQAGVAAAVIATGRQVGQALGVGLAGAILVSGTRGAVDASLGSATRSAWILVAALSVVICATGWVGTTARAHRSAERVRQSLFGE